MPLICYQKHRFDDTTAAMAEHAVAILEEYAERGFELTLRGLYYKFVARDLFPDDRKWTWTGSKWVRDPNGTKNAEPNYKWLGDIVTNARMSGLVDWDHLKDHTRNLESNPHWENPRGILEACASQFQIDKWKTQPCYIENWVEKDAQLNVISKAAAPLDVPYFSCRGYTSLSEMWVAGQRLLRQLRAGKEVHIIHLGDHDPSGIDMTRDIEDRLKKFLEHHVTNDFIAANPQRATESREQYEERLYRTLETYPPYAQPLTIHRIALNMDQVREYNPPPNPTKLGDSRSKGYIDEFGEECWELDALEPDVVTALITDQVLALRDQKAWDKAVREEDEHKRNLQLCADGWPEVVEFLGR